MRPGNEEAKRPRPVVKRDVFKVSEVAARTGFSSDFYWKKIREGKIKVLPMGSSVAISAEKYQRIITEGVA
ncbi:MAG TPA: hypothetical protein VG206_26660 [Terriglobia bacterium]|nr:hypothetical protein [Terriglobia bacterium]